MTFCYPRDWRTTLHIFHPWSFISRVAQHIKDTQNKPITKNTAEKLFFFYLPIFLPLRKLRGDKIAAARDVTYHSRWQSLSFVNIRIVNVQRDYIPLVWRNVFFSLRRPLESTYALLPLIFIRQLYRNIVRDFGKKRNCLIHLFKNRRESAIIASNLAGRSFISRIRYARTTRTHGVCLAAPRRFLACKIGPSSAPSLWQRFHHIIHK